MPVITKFTLLKRSPHVTHEQFVEHWRAIHGPLLGELPAFWKYNMQYFQNHALPLPAAIGAEPFWDGIAQTVQRPRNDMKINFFDEPKYIEVIRPDELKFLSITYSTAIFARQHIIKDGPRDGVKFISFIRPTESMTLEQFFDHWFHKHSQLVQNVGSFWTRIKRYVQNHGIPELSVAMVAGGKVESFAGVAELWFDSLEDAAAAFGDSEYIKRVRPDERYFISQPATRFVVREHEVLQPTTVMQW